MKIEFDPMDETEALAVRDFVNGLHCNSRGVADSMKNPVSSTTEVDDRVAVPDLPATPVVVIDAGPGIVTTVDQIPPPPATPAEQAVGMPEDDVDPAAKPAPERDKHGRIWDERIDSGNKKQTTGNEWMKRKNVDDALRQQVMAELTAADTAAPAEVFTPPVAPGAPVAVDPGAPPPPPEVTGAAAADGPDWGEVFTRIMTAKTAELVTQEQIDAKVLEYGIVGGFPALIARPDLYKQFLLELSIA